ncbi:BrnT family toxin [Massilia sp. YIM B04103]|uniref:BrnT family toxin n=1 Tax=Massilia sp. YIM B04103 TaxID=2963106 RepID=UPI002109688F|nr:BrnT family toxin [Massilia sp. YIM B04103]
MEMEIEFDAAKNLANRKRHGVDLALAARLDWDLALIWPDQRFAYDEQRMMALIPAGILIYHIAFVERAGRRRMISLRQASRKEKEYYVAHYQGWS